MSKEFYIDWVCRDDLLNAGLDEALVYQLSDEDMEEIALEIRDVVGQQVGDTIAEIANSRQQGAINELEE